MKIERINENTLKFYITYLDIEDRGFDIEEIWFNKERSEELFWQIMEEAHSQESFSLEGPLWIRVQALEKGMEILVTRAQVSKDGNNIQIPVSSDRQLELPMRNKADGEDSAEEEAEKDGNEEFDSSEEEEQKLTFVIQFKDIEDLIRLSQTLDSTDELQSVLYSYQSRYYLKITFSEETSEDDQDTWLSRILEYGMDTGVTESIIEEYGKVLIEEQAVSFLKEKFPHRY